MNRLKIIFLNHASFIIEFEERYNSNDNAFTKNNINKTKILVDPYLAKSSFNNGWNLLSEEKHNDKIEGINYIFYSHEHPDHFSVPFLKEIPQNKRSLITILYQETFDKRVKKFCLNLGYKFKEIPNKKETQINKNFSLIIGKVPVFDSWVNFKINNLNILNVNDCVLENPKFVFEIKKILKDKINLLFTQFSYANFIDNEVNRVQLAISQLEKIKLQDFILKPNYIIPFASFIYFSHEENKFMNKNINNIQNAYNYIIKNCSAKPIILKPNEEWDLNEKNNDSSLNYWMKYYKNINVLKYNVSSKSISFEQLFFESQKYLKRIYSKNNKFLIYILFYIRFFSKIKIYLHDHDSFFYFCIINGFTKENDEKNNKRKKYFIKMHSDSLSFIFCNDYGFDTLLVNARLKCENTYLYKVKRIFAIGSLNNTGRYLSFSSMFRLFNLNLIIRGLEIVGFKKRFY